jgi:hypothetical protein
LNEQRQLIARLFGENRKGASVGREFPKVAPLPWAGGPADRCPRLLSENAAPNGVASASRVGPSGLNKEIL